MTILVAKSVPKLGKNTPKIGHKPNTPPARPIPTYVEYNGPTRTKLNIQNSPANQG